MTGQGAYPEDFVDWLRREMALLDSRARKYPGTDAGKALRNALQHRFDEAMHAIADEVAYRTEPLSDLLPPVIARIDDAMAENENRDERTDCRDARVPGAPPARANQQASAARRPLIAGRIAGQATRSRPRHPPKRPRWGGLLTAAPQSDRKTADACAPAFKLDSVDTRHRSAAMFLRLAPLFAAATLLLVVASSPSYALVQSEIVNGSNMVVPYNLTAQVCVEVSAGHRATNGASLTFEVGGYDSNVLIAPYVEQTMEYSWNGGPWTIWPGSGSVWQSTVPYQVHWRFQGDRIPGAGWLKARYCQQPPKAGSILANHPFPKFTFQTWHDAADETTAIADGTQYAPSTTAAAVAAVEPTLMSLCTADAMRDVFVLGGTPYVVCAGENAPRALTTTPLACSPGEIPVFSWSDNAFVCQPAGQDRPQRWVGLDRMGTAISSDNALQAAIQGCNAGQADPNQYVARLMFSSQMESFTAECRSGADADGWPNLTSAVTFNAMCNDGTAWDPMVPVGCLPSLAANQYLKAVGLGFAGSIRELCGSYVPSFDEATGAFLCLDGATEVMRTLPDTCPTGQVFNDTRATSARPRTRSPTPRPGGGAAARRCPRRRHAKTSCAASGPTTCT
jgi:hypothetical protein